MNTDTPVTVLGFDFGTQRIGVAIGQTVTGTARALTTLKANHGQPVWEEITSLLHEWHPTAFVLGLPVHMDGSEHERTRLAKRFGNRLLGRYGLPVHYIDERLTSDEAERQLGNQVGKHRKTDIDAQAAQLILQDWLDQH